MTGGGVQCLCADFFNMFPTPGLLLRRGTEEEEEAGQEEDERDHKGRVARWNIIYFLFQTLELVEIC